jgi:DNA helicase II / ATP-dependent DNA helicase PcrA
MNDTRSMTFLDKLNPEQREAVLHTEGPLAHPGGRRVRQDACHREPHRVSGAIGPRSAVEVLAVTFTNKAAERDAGRVAALIGERARDLWVSTFHALLRAAAAPRSAGDRPVARLRHLRQHRSGRRSSSR